MTDRFTFYKSFYDNIQKLSEKEQLCVYKKIFWYAFYWEEDDHWDVCDIVFGLIKPSIKSSINYTEVGKKWWRPKKVIENKETKTPLLTPLKTPVKRGVKTNLYTNNIYIDNIITKKDEIKEHFTVEEVQSKQEQLKVLWCFIEMWYKIENTRKAIDIFFEQMIEKQKIYLKCVDRWLLLQKVDTMKTWSNDNWVITENHMSRLNKFLSPFKK